MNEFDARRRRRRSGIACNLFKSFYFMQNYWARLSTSTYSQSSYLLCHCYYIRCTYTCVHHIVYISKINSESTHFIEFYGQRQTQFMFDSVRRIAILLLCLTVERPFDSLHTLKSVCGVCTFHIVLDRMITSIRRPSIHRRFKHIN